MQKSQNQTLENEVLFQQIANKWYVFTEINGDMVYSALPEGMNPQTTKLELYNVIEDHMKKISTIKKPEIAA